MNHIFRQRGRRRRTLSILWPDLYSMSTYYKARNTKPADQRPKPEDQSQRLKSIFIWSLGLVFGIWASIFGLWSSGFDLRSLVFELHSLAFWLWTALIYSLWPKSKDRRPKPKDQVNRDFGLRSSGFGFWSLVFGLQSLGFGLWASVFRHQDLGFGLWSLDIYGIKTKALFTWYSLLCISTPWVQIWSL